MRRGRIRDNLLMCWPPSLREEGCQKNVVSDLIYVKRFEIN